MLAQTVELVEQGQKFADRFGWEALLVCVVLGFAGAVIWRISGKVAQAIASFLDASLEQLQRQEQHHAKTTEAIQLLSEADIASAVMRKHIDQTTADTNEKVNRLLKAILESARIAHDAIPDDCKEAKAKLLRVIYDLEK